MTSLTTPKSMTPVRLLWQAAQPGEMFSIQPHDSTIQHRWSEREIIRLGPLVEDLHRLGPRSLYEFMRELVGPDHALAVHAEELLRRYARLDPDTRRVLEQLVEPLEWTRLAITADQAKGLPAIQKPDNRYKPVRYHDAVETEALGQSEIVAIVRDHLDCLLPEPIGNVLERKGRERERVASLLVKITT